MLVGSVEKEDHFARECPKSTFDYNPKEDSAGRLNHHYIGSTDVSNQLWSEFLQKAATGSSKSDGLGCQV